MKNVVKFIVMLLSVTILSAKGDLHIFDVNNKDGSITTKQIEEAFVQNGFGIGVNSNMIKPYMIQFKKTDYKVFTLLTVYHKNISFELVRKYPNAGIFLPLSIGIYQSKTEDTLHISVLTAEAIEKITGINDSLVKDLEKEIMAVITKAMPNAEHKLNEDPLAESRELLTKYELELEGESFEDARESIMMSINNGLDLYGFVVPSKLDVNEHMKDSVYDFYQTYSICKLPVIYTASLKRPEASAFAPCSLMMYKKKDEDKIVIGFPSVHNWLSSARVQDKDAVELLLKAQKQFNDMLTEAVE